MDLSPEKLAQMQRRLAKLDALEAGGVDNWEGYDFALEDWRKEEELAELIDNAVADLDDILVDAEVDQPAGPGCGFSVVLPEAATRQMFERLVEDVRKLSN